MTQAQFLNYINTALKFCKLQFGDDQAPTTVDYYNEAVACRAACFVIEVGLKPQLLQAPMNYSPAPGLSISKEAVAHQLDECHARWWAMYEAFEKNILTIASVDSPTRQTFEYGATPWYGDQGSYGPYNAKEEDDSG